MHPTIRRLREGDFPIRLEPLSLIHVTAGDFTLRRPGEDHRLVPGELLAVRGGSAVRIERQRGSAEVLALQADPAWVERARLLFGGAGQCGAAADMAREAAGTEVARRTARLLLTAHLDDGAERAAPREGDEGLFGAGHAARLLELVGIALSMSGPLEAARATSGSRTRSRRAELARALEELECAAFENLSLRVLAERLGVCERQASRLLRDELGASFPAYLSSLRIERAKKLLITTNTSVTGVALETGWQSISHFNAVFRRKVGTTPSAFRAQYGGLAASIARP